MPDLTPPQRKFLDDSDRGSNEWFARLERAVNRNGFPLNSPELFEGLRYSAPQLVSLLSEARNQTGVDTAIVGGTVVGDLAVSLSGLEFRGQLDGSLTIKGRGDATLTLTGDAVINGRVDAPNALHSVTIEGRVTDRVSLDGGVRTLRIESSGRVADVSIGGNSATSVAIEGVAQSLAIGRTATCSGLSIGGTVTGEITVQGATETEVELGGSVGKVALARLSRSIRVSGIVEDSLTVASASGSGIEIGVDASVGGLLKVTGSVDAVTIAGRLGTLKLPDGADSITISKPVDGRVELGGDIGHLGISGGADELSISDATVTGNVELTPVTMTQLVSVAGSLFGGHVFIGDNVSIERCDFRRCTSIPRFDFVGVDLFPNQPLISLKDGEIPNTEMAAIYRQLRQNFEKGDNRPGAGKFYRGEMDARRRSASGTTEVGVLTAYKLLSGYGLRPLLPIAWFVGIAIVGALFYSCWGFETLPSEPSTAIELFTFSVKSMVSFLSPPEASFTTAGEWIQLAQRFFGPILLAQFAFAIREQVVR